MHAREVRPEEWRRYREMRLRALATDPRAFGAALGDEEAQPDAWWQARTMPDGDRTSFVAEEADAWLGICTLLAKEQEHEVVGMWVVPEARGRGVSALLLRAAEGRARAQDATTLTLWVNVEQEPARRAYARAGFVDDGPVWQGTRDPTRRYQKMRKAL